jgi:hypothetical protein
MGVLSIVAGILLLGALADYLIENDVAAAASQSVEIAGTTQRLSTPVLVAIAFVLGALALGLILIGIRSFRRGRRKTLQQRLRSLEDENARLHTQRNLQRVIRIPESPTDAPAPGEDAPGEPRHEAMAAPSPPQAPEDTANEAPES